MKEMEIKLSNPETLTLQDFELFIEQYFSEEEREEVSDSFIEDLVEKFSECYKKFLDNPKEEMPLLTKTLAYFGTTHKLESIALKVSTNTGSKGIREIIQNSIKSFISKEEIGEFITLLRSPALSGEIKIDLLNLAFQEENFPNAMLENDLLDAQKEIIRQIFYDFDASKYVFPELKCDLDFLNAFLNNQDIQRSEEFTKFVSRNLSDYLIDAFKENPEEWINSFEQNDAQTLLELSKKELNFQDLVDDLKNYLNNTYEPLDARIKLFQKIFEGLSQIKTDEQKYADVFLSLSNFIAKQVDLGMTLSDDELVKILKNAMDVFSTYYGINEFVKMMTSPRFSAEIKVNAMFSLFSHPDFVIAMQEDNQLNAKKRMIGKIFLDSHGTKKESEFLIAYFNFHKSHNLNISKELTDKLSVRIAHNMETEFKEDPEKWVDSLEQNSAQIIFEMSQDQSDFHLFASTLSEYLNDPYYPIESRIKLFCKTFESLSHLEDVHNHDEIFASYLKFIYENWKNDDVKKILKSFDSPFCNRLIKISLPSSFFNDSNLIDKIIKGENYQEFKDEELHHLYNAMKRTIVYSKLKTPGSKENKENELISILPDLFYENLNNFSRMVFLETIKEEGEKISLTKLSPTLIYNQSGYDTGLTFIKGEGVKEGAPIAKDDLPIGYNIYLPDIEIKGFVVQVYSGTQASSKNEKMHLPGKLNHMHGDLLNKGYAVATLNLVNLNKLNVYQLEMPQDLHTEIHDSIHHFYEIISKNPEKIHYNLHVLKDKPIHLFGASFGGRDAIRHAELHPGTFNSYISLDGALSFEMIEKSDIVPSEKDYSKEESQQWLDPSNETKKISDPILLIHNMNDHNVFLKVTLDFLKKARKEGKQDLIRLHVIEKGSLEHHEDDITNIGHFYSQEKAYFDDMMDHMNSFLEKGPSSLSALTDWKALRYNCLANKYYRSSTLEQRFISEAFILAKNKGLDDNWKDDFVPLYYTLHYLDVLSKDPNKGLDEMNRLKNENKLTQEVVRNALQSFLEPFLTFIKHDKGFVLQNDLDINVFINDPELQKEFVTNLTDDYVNYGAVHFLISSLYKSNPELLKSKFEEFEKDPQIKANLQKARDKLNFKLEKEKKIIIQVGQQAGQKVIASLRKERISQYVQEVKSKREEKEETTSSITRKEPLIISKEGTSTKPTQTPLASELSDPEKSRQKI